MVGVHLLVPTQVSNHFPFIFSRTFFTNSIFYFLLLVQAAQAAHVAEKWMNHAHFKFKNMEACHIAATKAQAAIEKKHKELLLKLARAERERKSVDTALGRAKKQTEEQCLHLRKLEDQLTITHEKIEAHQKELEGKVEAIVKAEQVGNDMCQKETKEILRSQVTEVCHGYCLYVWAEALDATRVDFASELRNPKKIFFFFSILQL